MNKVTGGRIPKEYIPSVDAGAQEAMQFGILAGYEMTGVRVTLIDGGYHEVDSSELAFKIAGSQAFKEAARKASPVLLEPMMAVEVTTPEDYMGEVIGDINSRRGQIQAMEERAGARVVKGLVPLSEMFGYVGDLRSKTSVVARATRCSSTPTPRFPGTSPRRSSRRPRASNAPRLHALGLTPTAGGSSPRRTPAGGTQQRSPGADE